MYIIDYRKPNFDFVYFVYVDRILSAVHMCCILKFKGNADGKSITLAK